MNVQLQEIKNIYIKNRLTEGVDFVRKEWLKGDGSAKISIIFNGWRETLDYIIQPIDGRSGETIYETSVTLSDTDIAEYRYFIGASLELTLRHGIRRNGHSSIVNSRSDGSYENVVYHISLKKYNVNKVALTDGGSISYKNSRFDSTLDFDAPMNIYANAAKISAFNTDRYNLVPCQLLKSIPATLDANNIARQAGECGMYDSISGKFYGNVASTGTFTVEGDVEPEIHTGLQQIYQNRLIEGEDYQTYDWLKADIPIITTMMALPISSKNFEFQRNFIQIMNSIYFNTSDSNSFAYYIPGYGSKDDLKPMIWNNNSSLNEYASPKVLGLGLHTIIANDNGVTISSVTNTASLPWYGSPDSISFHNANNVNKNTIHLTSSIKVNGVTRYVPCQLLRSIPRNLDAQCKERVAGECGMVDLISGKFYGNVASSGTFTVENDNNE